MAILDDLRYVGKISNTKAENEIKDAKEDGVTTSKSFRSTNDVRIWNVPKSYMTEAEKTQVEAWDDLYKTAVSFDFVRPDTGETMAGRLEKRLVIVKDPTFPKRFELKPFKFVESFIDWE